VTYPGIENDKALLATMDADVLAVETRRAEREAEFGEWVAITRIEWGTALAAVPGDPIPKDHIRRLKWDELGLVAKRSSKEGRAAIEARGAYLPGEQERWAKQDKEEAAARRAAERANQEAAKGEPEAAPADSKAGGGAKGGRN
jgi:hypothetical protein